LTDTDDAIFTPDDQDIAWGMYKTAEAGAEVVFDYDKFERLAFRPARKALVEWIDHVDKAGSLSKRKTDTLIETTRELHLQMKAFVKALPFTIDHLEGLQKAMQERIDERSKEDD